MSNRKTLRKIAKENGVTLKEVRNDMQAAINHAYQNPTQNGLTSAFQNRVPMKGEIPTIDEFLNYAVNETKKKI